MNLQIKLIYGLKRINLRRYFKFKYFTYQCLSNYMENADPDVKTDLIDYFNKLPHE